MTAAQQIKKLRADLTALDRSLSAARDKQDWRAVTELSEQREILGARLRRLRDVTEAE